MASSVCLARLLTGVPWDANWRPFFLQGIPERRQARVPTNARRSRRIIAPSQHQHRLPAFRTSRFLFIGGSFLKAPRSWGELGAHCSTRLDDEFKATDFLTEGLVEPARTVRAAFYPLIFDPVREI